MSGVPEEIDRLYGLPLDEFTSARDEFARRLRRDGDRSSAEELKGLRKPTVAAWALNQARRRDPDAVDRLLAAGEGLRDAQRQLLAAGNRDALREAAAEERRLAEELVAVAERQLTDGGHPVSASVHGRLSDTVHAVAGSDEARELLGAGRLVIDYQMSDLGLADAGGQLAPPARRPAPAKAPARAAPVKAQEARRARELKRKLDKARVRHGQLERKLGDAQQRARDAQRDAKQAVAAAERAQSSADQAEAAFRESSAETAELEAELAAAQRGG